MDLEEIESIKGIEYTRERKEEKKSIKSEIILSLVILL